MEQKSNTGSMFWGLLLIGLGVLFLLDQMHFMDFGRLISTFWPLILVGIGVKMLVGRDLKTKAEKRTLAEAETGEQASYSGERLQETRIFGDVNVRIDSQTFGGGNISTLFGDATIDLHNAQLKEGENILTVNTMFGDVRVIPPANGKFAVRTNAIFGDLVILEEKSGGFLVSRSYQPDGYSEAPNRLFISISTVFGDVVVA